MVSLKRRLILLLIWLLLWVVAPIALARMLYLIIRGAYKASWIIAISFDDLANVATGGELGQTISSRAAHARENGAAWGCLLCWMLDYLNRGHCDRALTARNQNLK